MLHQGLWNSSGGLDTTGFHNLSPHLTRLASCNNTCTDKVAHSQTHHLNHTFQYGFSKKSLV